MPITRTPIIDDSGSGTDGTVIDNAWKQELYNQIDGALVLPQTAPFRFPTGYTASLPAETNNWAGGAGAVHWALNPAAPTNWTGIVAEADGTIHILQNVTGHAVSFFNQHGNSSVANRFICPGFTTYVLGSWGCVWIIYMASYQAWIVMKP